MTKYKNKEIKILIKEILDKNKIDIVQIEYNIMHHYADYVGTITKVLMLHDVSTKLHLRSFNQNLNIFIKGLQYLDYLRWKLHEPKILRKFNKIITLTKEDKNFIKDWNIPEVKIIPPQIQFEDVPESLTKELKVIFIGSYNREPNIQALKILLQQIFPKLISLFPEIKISIIGKYLPNNIQKEIKQIEQIEYVGFVEDVNSLVSEALLMIAPIFIGSGLKMKIPHVLSCGVPVITTSVGAEGIDVDDNEGLWIEDDIDKMSIKCIDLLKSPEELIRIGLIGQEKVKNIYSSHVITEKLISVYQN